ncbi:MAG: hypothetical protein IPO07_08995 [Haliscomenobacter sp.]|nr:hypothetical protein [Haliscomenobacter sp.]MBK9488909.1 hypothetical protein [Haliscomenobacter sp.]
MKIRMMIASMLLMALIYACGTGSAGVQEQQIENEMMAEHDRIMPKMGELNDLYKDMRQYLFLDTTMTMDTRERLSMVTVNLKESEEEMMNWMNGISDLAQKKTTMKSEELIKYLTEQKNEIKRIGDFTDKSITEAKTALAQRKK